MCVRALARRACVCCRAPSSQDAACTAVGVGAAAGLNVNVAWNTRGYGRPGAWMHARIDGSLLHPIGRQMPCRACV
eukprot:2953292-Pleurochrysis_carterae.AAC.1